MYLCIDSRECFAKGKKHSCLALSVTYSADGACPFCKKEARITDGKYYPLDPVKGGAQKMPR